MATTNFDNIHPKIIEITFSFPASTSMQKVISFTFLRYSQFWSPVTRLATPISDYAYPKIFWSNFKLCEFDSACEKSGYFIDLFWRSGWLKNPEIWLAENILAHISETEIFLNMGFLQEHSK